MSPSNTVDGAPSVSTLLSALQDAVKDVFVSGALDNLTVKRVRAAVESKFELPDGFFKRDSEWNAKSKTIIQSASEEGFAKGEDGQVASSSVAQKHDKDARKAESTTEPPGQDLKKGIKRASPSAGPRQAKRQKSEPQLENNSDDSSLTSQLTELESPGLSEDEEGPSVKRARKQARVVDLEESDGALSTSKSEPRGKGRMAIHSKRGTSQANDHGKSQRNNGTASTARKGSNSLAKQGAVTDPSDSESEMSVVMDEAPAPKKNRRKSSPSQGSKKAGKIKAPSRKDDSNVSPQEAEIKRLQSWLLKCGIRKLWHRELAKYDGPASKIKHLKDMLRDAGMDGRFSAEKAKQIKEERELKAEVEAVQDNAKLWGEVNEEDDDDGGHGSKPKRRLARGLKELDFLGEDGGEETD